MSKREIVKGKSGVAFFEYTSWCHRYKVIENNGKVKYLKLKGFKTEEEATESYYKYKKEFEDQQREFYASVDKEIMFKDYLIYWFNNVYSERIESNTKIVGAYIVFDLIIPNIDYDVKINIGNFEFPTKNYGDISLPAGYYDALRVEIGEAKGQNWWCVMFPPLCFVDISSGIVPDESKDVMKDNLTEEEFALVSDSSNHKVQFKFKLLEFFTNTGLITAKK